MSRLTLTCPECHLDMMVPANAIGRTGLCPECGATIPIREDNTRPYTRKRARSRSRDLAPVAQPRETTGKTEDSWRQFATAVDLYNQRRYAEALTLLSELQEVFPGNPHVTAAQEQCLRALQEVIDPGMRYAEPEVNAAQLTPDLVKRVVLDKMLNGQSEAIQLQAADLAARLLSMTGSSEGDDGETASPDIILGQKPAATEETREFLPSEASAPSAASTTPPEQDTTGEQEAPLATGANGKSARKTTAAEKRAERATTTRNRAKRKPAARRTRRSRQTRKSTRES